MRLLVFLIEYFKIKFEYYLLRKKFSADTIIGKLVNDGYVVIPNFVSIDLVKEYLNFVPSKDKMTLSPEGTQTRYWVNADKIKELNGFYENELIKNTINCVIGEGMTRLRATIQRRDTHGWTGSFEQFFHCDTWQHRIKAFLYLTDVSPKTGPLIYAPRTQRGLWRLAIDHELWYITKVGQDTFLENEDSQFAGTLFPHQSNRIFRKLNTKPVEILGEAGTLVIFDARGLHKVKPLEEGERIILSSYWVRKGKHI